MTGQIQLRCPKCNATAMAKRFPDDPPRAMEKVIICLECDDGDFHSRPTSRHRAVRWIGKPEKLFKGADMPLTEQQAIERRKIMDRGTRMMDAIAAAKGENDPMFWSAMQVMLDQVDDFDRRHGLKKFG